MNKNTMYGIVAAVVIVVVVAAVAGAYVLMNPGGGGGGDGGGDGGGADTYVVTNATSLQFNVDETLSGITTTYNIFANKTVSTETMLRFEIAGTPSLVYILDGGQHKVWSNATGTWNEEDFTTQWDYWSPKFEGYVDSLAHWTTGEYTYTAADGTSVRIYNIVVNPTLDASLFKGPT